MDEVKSQLILYQTEDGRTRVECRFENETIWLSQKLMAECFRRTCGPSTSMFKMSLMRGNWCEIQLSGNSG